MKILVTENQYRKILREEKEQKILRVPGLNFFHENHWEAWQILQKVLERRGNPPYTIDGYLEFEGTTINSLGNLTSVGGDLDLINTPIKSLGNLEYVGRTLDVQKTSIDSLGKLQYVGGDLNLYGTPLSDKFSYTEIKEVVNVMGAIFM